MRGMDTKDRIMYVAMDLISAKGFKAVTIKEVANGAGVSEMTVFRKFTNKKNLLMEAFARFSVSFPFQEVFEDQLTGDPDVDLLNICRAHYRHLEQNRRLLNIFLKEDNNIPELRAKIRQFPVEMKKHLIAYFEEMQEAGKLPPGDAEKQYSCFSAIAVGQFWWRLFVNDNPEEMVLTTDVNACLEYSVRSFLHGVQAEARP